MTAITSPVDICNMALSHLGQRDVQNIASPTSDSERVCALWYDVTRQGLLREYVWRFAKARKTISRVGSGEFDWTSAYQLPNDFLRLLSINGEREVFQTQHYDVEGRNLLLNGNNPSIDIRYVRDNTNVGEWDPLFKIMLSYKLAMAMAYKFTLKKGLTEDLSKRIAECEPKAATVNAQERPPVRIQRSRYLRARGDGSYGGGGYFTGPITDIGE